MTRPARAGLAAIVVLLAAAPGAAAADRVYGGQPTPSAAPSPALIALGLAEDGSRLQWLAYHVEVPCLDEIGGGTVLRHGAPAIVPAVPASPRDRTDYLAGGAVDGSAVHWVLSRTDRYANGRSVVISGAIDGTVAPSRASGTMTLSVMFVVGGDSIVGCGATVPWRADRRPGEVFAGRTSQGEPIVFELAPNGARVRHAHIGWHARCAHGLLYGSAHDELGWRSSRLSPSGAFAIRRRTTIGGARVAGRVAGRVATGAAKGTFSARATFRSDGDRCSARAIRWTAGTG
jgi:hypothetical protein